jgi:hypothetical protein
MGYAGWPGEVCVQATLPVGGVVCAHDHGPAGRVGERWTERESVCVLFIGTQFSNFYTAVDTPARGRVGA